MSDEQSAKYVDGVAVHWYLDFIVPVKVLNDVHKDFGDKIIINTEASQGTWSNWVGRRVVHARTRTS